MQPLELQKSNPSSPKSDASQTLPCSSARDDETLTSSPLLQIRQHLALKGTLGWETTANAGVRAWVEGTGPTPGPNLREELGGAAGVLRAITNALLVAGSKSFTHMITALERYLPTLESLLAEAGPAVSLLLGRVGIAESIWMCWFLDWVC